MKLPWGKSRRGAYRTAKDRLNEAKTKVGEQKFKIDEMLYRAWYQDLQDHPEYRRELARQKFGLGDTGEELGGYTEPSFVEQLKGVREAKESLDDIFGGQEQKGSGVMGLLSDVVKQDRDGQLSGALAGLIGIITEKMKQGQPLPSPQPQLAQPQPEQPTQEEQITTAVRELLALSPEQAALQIYNGRETEGSIACLAWNSLIGVSVDDVLNLLPALNDLPQYQYLMPFAHELMTKPRKQWLALLVDECNRLNAPEIVPESTETMPETEASQGETE